MKDVSPDTSLDRPSWLHADPDPDQIERLARAEIEEALTATPTPRQWHPVEVEEEALR
jgi:hypothetical protein